MHCGFESTVENNFYKHRSKIIDQDIYSICKNCGTRLGNTDIETLHKLLMILDIPFIPDDYKRSEGKDNQFGHYMLLVNNPKRKYENGKDYIDLTYSDSPQLRQVKDVDEYIYEEVIDEMGDLVGLFGDTWTADELKQMSKELDEMVFQYGGKREDIASVDLYSEIILLKWLSRRAFNAGDAKTGNDLSKTRATLLKNNKMTLQDVKDKDNQDSLSLKIDMAEDRPIVPDKKYHDVDGINFMHKMLIKHMERFIGANKSSVDEDYEEMNRYVQENADNHYSEELE